MKWLPALPWIALCALLTACSTTPDTTPTPSATASAASVTATSPPPSVPVTGVAIVDRVTAAVAEKDASKLASLLHFWPMPCAGGQGSASCPAGAPPGTSASVVGFSYGETGFMQPGAPNVQHWTQKFVDEAGMLHAVLRAPTSPPPSPYPGTYQIIFEPGMVVSVDDQGVTFMTFDSMGAAKYLATGRFGWNPEYLVKP